jgi:ABC-type uncharacterized transport system involved in gliding motility auxiliary subunit
VFAILGLVNYLSQSRFNKRVDLTANSVNSLSEQSDKVLKSLDAPLKLTLFDQTARFDQYRDRLSMYGDSSNRVTVEYVDGDREPARAKQAEIQAYPTILIDYKGKTEKVTTVDERDLTGAIIRATTGQQRKVYFVQGHGEKDPNSNEPSGMAGVVQYLKLDNIGIDTLALAQKKDVPDDASVVVIAGPTTDFLDDEIEMLKRYLDKGGRLLLMVDPVLGGRDQQLTKLTALMKDWGLEIGNDVIIDLSGRSPNGTFIVAGPPYPPNPILDNFRKGLVFPLARSVTPITPAPAGKTAQKLVETSSAAWAETNLDDLRKGTQPQPDTENGDKAGPVGIAATVTTASPPPADAASKDKPAAPPQTRIAVFGDSDFASNAAAGNLGNVDFFPNTINWLTAQESLIAIRPREAGDSRLTITPGQTNLVWWFSVLFVPAAVFGTGILAWMRRRRS